MDVSLKDGVAIIDMLISNCKAITEDARLNEAGIEDDGLGHSLFMMNAQEVIMNQLTELKGHMLATLDGNLPAAVIVGSDEWDSLGFEVFLDTSEFYVVSSDDCPFDSMQLRVYCESERYGAAVFVFDEDIINAVHQTFDDSNSAEVQQLLSRLAIDNLAVALGEDVSGFSPDIAIHSTLDGGFCT